MEVFFLISWSLNPPLVYLHLLHVVNSLLGGRTPCCSHHMVNANVIWTSLYVLPHEL